MKLETCKAPFKNLGFIVRFSLLAVSIIPLLVYLIMNNVVVTDNFLRLEEKNVQARTAQTVRVLQHMTHELAKQTTDYAIWDEPYVKVREKDTEWFKENVTGWLPQNSGVDLIVIADTNKIVVDQYGAAEASPLELLNDSSINKVLKNGNYQNPATYPNGLIMFQGKLYLITVSPILKSYYKGTPTGIIIFGKLVGPYLLDDIKQHYGYQAFVSFGDNIIASPGKLSESRRYANIYEQTNKREVTEVEKSLILGSNTLYDIAGKEVAKLFILEPRDVFLSTVSLVRNTGYLVLALSMMLILLLSEKLRRVILNPIHMLEQQISGMGRHNLLGHVDVRGSQEIISLATTFNRMTDGLLEYKKENESLKNLSITDDLTSIYNHRYFYECFDDRIGRGCKQLTLFFCDIDHFKMINDLNGHIVGDLVLREIAVILKESVGAAGDVFRYGGEEFVILVDNLRSEEAFKLAETVRLKVANSKILEQKSGYFPVTISIGIARYLIDAMNGEALVKSADMAMYYAKQNGRNQCQVYDSELPEKLAKQSLEFSKQEMLLESAYTLAAIIDAKDKYTEKHSESVIKFSLRLAEKLRMSDKDKYVLKIGALLHDIGKIGIADDVLHKDGPLSEHEWKIVKNHPVMGSNIIKHIIKTPDIETCIRYHHERWDGKGYPEGLTGQAIPIYARIICLADAFHAMISDRPYRTALSQEEAFNQLRKNMGIQFDPDLVEPFIAAVREPSGDVFAEPCANTI